MKKFLFILLSVALFSCQKNNLPKIDFELEGNSIHGDGNKIARDGDTISRCYPYAIHADLKNVYRYRYDHSCGSNQNTIAPTGHDTLCYTERGWKFLKATAWNDDGDKVEVTKNYYVK